MTKQIYICLDMCIYAGSLDTSIVWLAGGCSEIELLCLQLQWPAYHQTYEIIMFYSYTLCGVLVSLPTDYCHLSLLFVLLVPVLFVFVCFSLVQCKRNVVITAMLLEDISILTPCIPYKTSLELFPFLAGCTMAYTTRICIIIQCIRYFFFNFNIFILN